MTTEAKISDDVREDAAEILRLCERIDRNIGDVDDVLSNWFQDGSPDVCRWFDNLRRVARGLMPK